jgi:hypothetical protein
VNVESAVIVDRPRSEVFRRVVDDFRETQPLICSLTLSVEPEGNGAIAIGTRGRLRVRNSSFTTTLLDFEVTDYAKDVRFRISARRGKRQLIDEYSFADVSAGTAVRIESSFELAGPRWLQRWNLTAVKRHCDDDCRRLKDLLEGRGTPRILAARNRWRPLIALVLASAIIAVIWATVQSLSS